MSGQTAGRSDAQEPEHPGHGEHPGVAQGGGEHRGLGHHQDHAAVGEGLGEQQTKVSLEKY